MVIASMLSTLATAAQERVTIKDPDLHFSYILPKGWSNLDDDLYHYIINPDTSIQLSLTYYAGMCKELNECYEGEVQGRMKSEYSGFVVVRESEGMIAGVPAKWAQCTGARDGFMYTIVAYFLVWKEQYFQIVAYLPENADQTQLQLVDDLVKSLNLRTR